MSRSMSIAGVLVLALNWACLAKDEPVTKPSTAPSTQPRMKISLDLDKALNVAMPKIEKDLTATDFKTPDGKGGWAIRIPGGRPIATPAFFEGMLFVGGGYGSHEFYAFDAASGKVVWQIKTADDGPTAAVVEDGYVAFNTESCTVIVVDARTGKLIWQEWLGDPLMSQPAISKGRLYIAYPGANPRGVQSGDKVKAGDAAPPATGALINAAQNAAAQQQVMPGGVPATKPGGNTVGPAKGMGHRLLCADLKTGTHIWEQDITAEVITAPVVDGDQVFFTCFDGTSFCVKADNGQVVWKKEHSGQTAPLLVAGNAIIQQKVALANADVAEGMVFFSLKSGAAAASTQPVALGKADYYKPGASGNVTLSTTQQAAFDASVGFAGGAPAMAQMGKAMTNSNIGTVAGAWAYQGSRAAYNDGRLMQGQANRLNCVLADGSVFAWQAEATGKGIDGSSQIFCPPALGKKNMYVCSARGELLSMDQKEGSLNFAYALKVPIAFQPALAGGNMYAGTADGLLICLKTGDKDADGWFAWGGNAQHNKKE